MTNLPHNEIMLCTKDELKKLINHVATSITYFKEIGAPERLRRKVDEALQLLEEEQGKLRI